MTTPQTFHERRSTPFNELPASTAASRYAELAEQILTLIQPAISSNGDPSVRTAAETIGRNAVLLAVNTQRGASSFAGAGFGEQVDTDDRRQGQWDGTGGPQFLRRLIRESRDAWRILLAGYAFVGQLAATMIAQLTKLDAAIAGEFPRAPEFVRKDFDEATG